MKFKYENAFSAWSDFENHVINLLTSLSVKTVGEIGAGANPLLTNELVEQKRVVYDVIDISVEELGKAAAYYNKMEMDFAQKDLRIIEQYDFLFAQMTLEHIADPATFYKNVYQALKPEGHAFFFFACDTMLPTRINKLLPEFISDKVLKKIQPFRKDEKHGKFKAHYKWCKGPTQKNIRRIESSGLTIVSYTGYFGHSYYQRIPFLNTLEKLKTNWLFQHPVPALCSYSHVLLQKPLGN